jgi:hypothetical protein
VLTGHAMKASLPAFLCVQAGSCRTGAITLSVETILPVFGLLGWFVCLSMSACGMFLWVLCSRGGFV